MICLPI